MVICPKCGRKFERLLAVSRENNETMICDECGTAEALQEALDAWEDYRKISVKVSVYYEIRDSEMYGGVGSIGYACTHINGNLEMMNNDFKEYVLRQRKHFASGLGVPEECVRVITQEEYEQNTEYFELGGEDGGEYADQPTLISGA